MAKKKDFKLTIAVPDEQVFKAIMDAHGLANYYRAAQGTPAQSVERFLYNCAIEGSNQLFQYHKKQQALLAEQEKAKVSSSKDDKLNVGSDGNEEVSNDG